MDRRILAALDKAPATVILLSGPELRYAWMNELFRKMFTRIQVGDLFGTTTPLAVEFRALAERVYRTGEPALLKEVEAELADGRGHVWFDLWLQAVRDEAGKVDAVVIGGTDITAVVTGRRALGEQGERTR